MIYLEENTSIVSTLIENQFPQHVQENNPKFLKFLSSYYESQELKYQPLDIVSNLIDYYNISYFRPNRLIESTKVTQNVFVSHDSVNVENTEGFPEKNGYIQIDDEIIFYRSKTRTSFDDCERGQTALVLLESPQSELTIKNSTAAEHKKDAVVKNLAFPYVNEFLKRIKSEHAVLLPKILDENLDISTFIKKIKSFYSAKGSLNSHRILFRILFNDRKFNIKLKNRGSGATLKVSNFSGYIPGHSSRPGTPVPRIATGGSGYDSRVENGTLINPPIIEVFGSGTGMLNPDGNSPGLRPNPTAVISVTGITNGEITQINVDDEGFNYRGPITTRIRPRNFLQDQLVYNESRTGLGRVEYFDAFTSELILYNVVGYFSPNDEILTDTDEKARAFIAQSYTTPILSRTGLRVDGEQQNIEFPREYTFKTSNSSFTQKKIIRCKILQGSLPQQGLPDAFLLKQQEDKLFGVSGVEIAVDNVSFLTRDIFEFEVSSNSNLNSIYLPPSTVITKQKLSITNTITDFILTVDSTVGFPVTNGIISVNGKLITYKSRSSEQFFGCNYNGSTSFDVNVKDEVVSYGRNKIADVWSSGLNIKKGDYISNNDNLYIAQTSGITGSTTLSHTSNSAYDGSLELGDTNPVLWRFIGPNLFEYSFYIDYNNPLIENPRLQILGMPGDFTIVEGGSLHSNTEYKFTGFDSPNVDVYNFTTKEISDRLALVLGTNYNKSRATVTDSRLPAYESLVGFNSQYDYEDYIYVACSGVPRWWNDIVDLTQTNLSTDETKKISFTNQKLLTRWKKSGLIYESQAVGVQRKTKKLLGLNIDAIQVNSYKGNTIEYGKIEKFIIGDGGKYPVAYNHSGSLTTIGSTVFDNAKNPSFSLKPNDGNSITVDNTRNFTRISAGIKKIDYNLLFTLASRKNDADQYITPFDVTNLIGFTERPLIKVVNNNPKFSLTISDYSVVNDSQNQFEISGGHNLTDGEKITFTDNQNVFTAFNSSEYYVNVISTNNFSLHKTKSDALIDRNRISLSVREVNDTPVISPFSVEIVTDIRNPLDYRPAVLDLSYKNGSIDNILILDSGSGYVEAPDIVIYGGGKSQEITIPYVITVENDEFNEEEEKVIVEMEGPLVSFTNYYKENYNEIDKFTEITDYFNLAPAVSVVNGSGAEGIAYTNNGVIESVSLSRQGSSYSIAPEVRVTGDGKDAVILSRINDSGNVVGFEIINPGSGYTIAPRIDIIPIGSGGLVSSRLKQWTFNLVRQLNQTDRIDSYGGYVYHEDDAKPSSSLNPKQFTYIDYDNDFPKDINRSQYYLMQNSDKLTAKYVLEKAPELLVTTAEAALSKTRDQFTDAEIFASFVSLHSPAIVISYDGVPIYAGNNVYVQRNKPLAGLAEIKSRYRLKYTEHSSAVSGSITLTTTAGTKYVTLSRDGGPSISEYPIGSFIEDYEYVTGGDDDLDEHNGRFSITPEFPQGRYCYFTTRQSYDPITNALVESTSANNNNIGFNGFPYFIGDTFASEYDDYMNNRCRTNDQIPSKFIRAFEKDVDPLISDGSAIFGGLPAGAVAFAGLKHNDEYPQEDRDLISSIVSTKTVSPGSVDSIIIESRGDGYRVGDVLKVDNTLSSGSGFAGFVSKVSGKQITFLRKSENDTLVEFETTEPHGLKINDFIYFDYPSETQELEIYLHGNANQNNISDNVIELDSVEVALRQNQPKDFFKNKKIYSINLNFKFKYLLNINAGSDFKLTYDIEAINEFFTLEDSPGNTVRLNAQNIPNRLYLHITGTNYIYELNKTKDYYGPHRVKSLGDTNKKFKVKFPESTKLYEKRLLTYSAKSYGASGPIEEISISNPGFNYRKLPVIADIVRKGSLDITAGNGKAIIQANSSSIGKIKKIVYGSVGQSFTANSVVNHYLDIPSTAKIINNFEIYEIEVVNGGENYDNTVSILVNGSTTGVELKATVNIGTITNIEVVNGGTNYVEEPTITVSSTNGSGAVLKAKIRRRNVFADETLTGSINSTLFPIKVNTKVVNFDVDTSTLEFNEISGQFKENDTVYLSDGRPYGKIRSIRRSRAFSNVSSYAVLDTERTDITGNPSEYLQKITDSDYYQDWSYSISSSRDTIEWKKEQNINTHPAGFKQFGRKLIERRKFFFRNPSDVFKSSVIFTTNIVDLLDLKVSLAECKKQTIFTLDTTDFEIGKYYIGIDSQAIGVLIEKTDYSLVFRIRTDKKFVLNEVLIEITSGFAYGLYSNTDKVLAFWNGILQEPEESYDVATNYDRTDKKFIPYFSVSATDQIPLYSFTNSFDVLDSKTLKANESEFFLNYNQSAVTINNSNIDQFIISIGGSVQDPDDLTVTNNNIVLGETVGYDSRVFAIRSDNLSKLTFTATGSGNVYTINHNITDPCKLLIFYSGVFQTQLLPQDNFDVSGNTITFSENVSVNEIFGWYINEPVDCENFDVSQIDRNRVLNAIDCVTKNFKQLIESNAVKTPESLYELRKETIDGTVYPVNSTTVEGFDTNFVYTSPRHSSSYVEVLDRIAFDGSTTQFNLTANGHNYTPSNGEESLVVYLNNIVLDHDLYSVSGSTITFTQTYADTVDCTLLDYVSDFTSNTNNENGAIIDRLNVSQNNSRTTFNLSDRGVPKYVNNVGDIFVVRDGQLKIPTNNYIDHRNITLGSHTLNDNKITFNDAPSSSEVCKLAFFNRQLLPEPSKNVILDRFRCFDNSRTVFPITVDGILYTPISVYHVYMVRNGVFQKPGIDYTVSGYEITFTTAPKPTDIIFGFYSFDGLNQNSVLDLVNYVDGVNTDFGLTVNYVSTTVISDDHLMVFRNGVYQTPTTDYTVLSNQNGPYIRFTTAPTVSEEIYMVNLKELNFETPSFTQPTSNTISISAPSNLYYDDEMFLVFVNGILMVGNAYTQSYSSGAYTLTFAANLNISTDNVNIYAFSTGGVRRELDSIAITNTSTLSYTLSYNGSAITNVGKDTDLIVTIEGVVQEPGVSYTVSGSTITFSTTALYQTGVNINIFQIGDSTTPNATEYIDYIDDNFNKLTQVLNGVTVNTSRYKLYYEGTFRSFNPPNSDDLFILRNGVVQNPTEDFTTGNGYVEFTTNISAADEIFIMYTHGSEELSIASNSTVSSSVQRYTMSSSISSSDFNNIVVFADGVPRFYERGDFTISGVNIDLTHTDGQTPAQVFVMKYINVTVLDDPDDCPNGSRTAFKLLYNNQNLSVANTANDADILVSINGVVQHPGTQYTLSANRAIVNFTSPPQMNDEIFMVRMLGSDVRNLTATGTPNQYTLSSAETTQKENIVIFSNNTWKFAELGDFTWNSDTTITLSSPHTTGNLFAIKFYGVFNLLDQINTPFNGSNTKFNLFDGEENFVPVGTVDNDNVPDETSLLVLKNNRVLDPKVDFTLTGDIKSQILFSTAPASGDVISVRSVGSFLKLDTISNSSGQNFNLTLNGNPYYPNAHIERPRDHENQIMVIVDGLVLSPLYDYIVHNDGIATENSLSAFSKMVILDFRGTQSDVKVYDRINQINVGDELSITSEDSPRKVTQILSPTLLKTESYTGGGFSNFSATTNISNGRIDSIVINTGTLDFEDPVAIKTIGTGEGAYAIGYTNQFLGGTIISGSMLYPGNNVYNTHYVYPTVYATVYKKQPINKSQIRKGTKLSSNINSTVETISLANTFELPSNTPTITVSSSSGQNASFKVYISGGELRKIDILNAGSGYDDRDITIELTGGGGTGCVLEPVIDAQGSFTDVIIRNPGVGYDTFRVMIYNESGGIVNEEVIEYTYVTSNQIDGCTRGVLGTASAHNANDIVYFDNYL